MVLKLISFSGANNNMLNTFTLGLISLVVILDGSKAIKSQCLWQHFLDTVIITRYLNMPVYNADLFFVHRDLH